MSAQFPAVLEMDGDWQHGAMIGFTVLDNGVQRFESLPAHAFYWNHNERPEQMLERYGFDTFFTSFGKTGTLRAEVYQAADGIPVDGVAACFLVEFGFTPYVIFVFGTIGEAFTLLRELQTISRWGTESLQEELELLGGSHNEHDTDDLF